jgi:hypothetical protein
MRKKKSNKAKEMEKEKELAEKKRMEEEMYNMARVMATMAATMATARFAEVRISFHYTLKLVHLSMSMFLCGYSCG